jgi:hypothetical protein
MVAARWVAHEALATAIAAWCLAAGAGCGGVQPPVLEARNSLGYVIADLYTESDGFTWWDGDVEGAGHGLGKITLIGDTMIANGGGCGVYGWGGCDATFANGRIEIHLPDENGAHPLLTFGLQRTSDLVQLDDGAGGVLLALQATADGNATIYGRTGVMAATTQKSAHGIQVLNGDPQPAYIGAVDSDVPPDLAALALGEEIDTSGKPHIPQHALLVASAMT